jgi:hypothetical protein
MLNLPPPRYERSTRWNPPQSALLILALCLLWPLGVLAADGDPAAQVPPAAAGTGTYLNNGTWMDYAYLCKPEYLARLPEVATQMKESCRVPVWFLNVGSLDENGKLQGRGVSNVVSYLNALKSWEDKNHYHFQVFAWLNANWPKVSVTNPAVRANMVEECRKLVSAKVPNSYIVGASRAFDGIQLDYEPCGQPNKVFDSLVNFFDQVHTKFAAIGAEGKLTSFTPEKYGTNNSSEWCWGPQFYYDMAPHLDLLCAMTYDTGIKVGSEYHDWMEYQTTNILRAVSGKWWDNDTQHPPPTNHVKVMIGFPAFPNSKWHTNTVENVIFASSGVKAGLAELSKRGDDSVGYFEGAALYAHSDGKGTGGYANNDTDWRWFKERWLNAR